MGFFKNKDAKNSLYLGTLCAFSYLAVYFARNILSAVSPQMLESSNYTVELIGTLSSCWMILYAIGQLINGIIGDHVSAKYMVSGGLLFAGICNLVLPFSTSEALITTAYGLSGFFLSMIYAPIVRVVSESTLPHYASRACLGFTFSSFLGSPLAGLAALIFNWKAAFIFCSIFQIVMSIICYILFSVFEKKQIIKYLPRNKEKGNHGSFKILFKHQIVKFTFVAMLTGIVRTSVLFWIPTYTSQYLSYTSKTSATIYTVITLIMSFASYFNILIVYERIFKRKQAPMLFAMFGLSAIFFICMPFISNSMINVICLGLALFTASGCANILWSVYCPSLKETGMVSSATGWLDFMSYIAAAIANILFANAVDAIGWTNLIIVWAVLMFAGVLIFIPLKFSKKQ